MLASFSRTDGFSESQGRNAFSRDIMRRRQGGGGSATLSTSNKNLEYEWSTNRVALFSSLGGDALLYIKEVTKHI
jgi:hypothetical protein